MSVLPRADTFEVLSQRHGSRYGWLVLLVVGLGMVAGALRLSPRFPGGAGGVVVLVVLVMLAGASVAGFLAPTFELVVGARILQGLAAGVLQPMGPIALMRLFPPASPTSTSHTPTESGRDQFVSGWQSTGVAEGPHCHVAR